MEVEGCGCAQVLGMRALKPYAPDFSTAFEHFCIHPGGKAVISEVGPCAHHLEAH